MSLACHQGLLFEAERVASQPMLPAALGLSAVPVPLTLVSPHRCCYLPLQTEPIEATERLTSGMRRMEIFAT